MTEKLPLRDQILALFKEDSDQTFNKSEFARALSLPSSERSAMRQVINELEKEGLIEIGRRARYNLVTKGSKTDSPLIGTIRILNNGHGSLRLDEEYSEHTHVFIPSGNCGTALTGDKVLVELENKNQMPKWMKHSKKHQERYKKQQEAFSDELKGKVMEIIERGDARLVGTVFKKNSKFYIETDSPSLPNIVEINEISEAKSGQKVVLELERWDVEHLPPVGNVIQVLGWSDSPGVDILGIIHRHNLSLEFPEEVEEQAKLAASTVTPEEISTRLDCRDYPICTIDPHDARDHDDAIWVERIEKDGEHLGWKLQVHIADVSYFVKPGTELDIEAYQRGNSTYLVDRVIPMLPTVLSNGMCSLVPDEDRLTKCALITFNPEGKIIKSEFHSAIIRSKDRLSYEDAQEILDQPKLRHPLADDVREAWKLASLLRKKRFVNGALDLEFPEYRINMNEFGKADGYRLTEHSESHQLIEEFMLIANEAAALALKNGKKPTVYRVHEDPDFEKLHEFGEMARILGFKAGDLTSKQELQKLINQLSGSTVEQTLKLSLLKSLKRATYSPEPLGHYGLAKANYTHFTSPIRRYADLIVHRSLQGLLKNPPKQLDKVAKGAKLVEVADHISITERTSAEAEIDSKRLKLLEWLDTQSVGTGGLNLKTAPEFKALVTDVRPLGLFIELKDTMQRGIVKVRDLPPGFWQLDDKKKQFVNTKKGKKETIKLADEITVKVKHVDFDRLRVDFYLS